MEKEIMIEDKDREMFEFLRNFKDFVSGKTDKETFMQTVSAQSSSTDTTTTKTKQELIADIIDNVTKIQDYIRNKYQKSTSEHLLPCCLNLNL